MKDISRKDTKKRMQRMSGKRKRAAALALLAALSLGACSLEREQVDLGMDAIEALDYQGALALFEAAREAGEDERLALRGMGIAYMGLTEYDQAAVCFEEALGKSSGLVQEMDYDLNYYLAAAYTKSGRLEEAESTYEAILAMRPQEADAFFLRGNVRMGLDRFEEAKEDFAQAVKLQPEDYGQMIQIYEVLNQYGCGEEGKAMLNDALSAAGEKMSDFDRGRIYYYLGEYQQAYTTLEQAKDSQNAEVYLYLGKSYEAAGDYNYASTVYQSYIDQKQDNAEIFNQLGLCEIQKGDYQKALTAFQEGLKVENNTMRQALSFNEIVAYENLGDFQKATVLMETYLANYPDDAKAQREYSFLKTR